MYVKRGMSAFLISVCKVGVGSTLLASLGAVEATGKHVDLVGMGLLLAPISDWKSASYVPPSGKRCSGGEMNTADFSTSCGKDIQNV